MNEFPDDLFEDSASDPEDALTQAERDLLAQALTSSAPTLDPQTWQRLLDVATDPETPDPGLELVTGTASEEGPFDVAPAPIEEHPSEVAPDDEPFGDEPGAFDAVEVAPWPGLEEGQPVLDDAPADDGDDW